MHSKQHCVHVERNHVHFFLKIFRAGLDALLDFILYQSETTVDIVLSVGLAHAETSCVLLSRLRCFASVNCGLGMGTLNILSGHGACMVIEVQKPE